jgi:hypothetical protein
MSEKKLNELHFFSLLNITLANQTSLSQHYD